MKLKLSLVFLVLFGGFSSFVLYRTWSFYPEKSKATIESYTQALLNEQALQIDNDLKSFGFQAQHPETLGDLLALYRLQLKGSQFEIMSSNIKPSLAAASSSLEAQVRSLVGEIKETQNPQFYFFLGPDKKSYIAIFYPQQGSYFLGLSSTMLFQNLIEKQEMVGVESVVINQKAEVLAHSKSDYIGTRALEHPLFVAAQKKETGIFSTQYSYQDGVRWGMVKSVPKTNLLIMFSVPMEFVQGGAREEIKTLVVLSLGIFLLGLGLIVMISGTTELELKKQNHAHQILQSKLRLLENEKNNQQKISLSPQEKDSEKFEAYGRIASAIAFEIRTPLTSILAYAQSLLNHVKDSESTKWVESILKEARQVRWVLDKMFVFAGIQEGQVLQTKLEGVLLKVLKELEPLLKEKGIVIKKDFKSNLTLPIQSEAMERVFRNLLLNSIESMERMPKKEITLTLKDQEDFVHFTIQDTGEGIEADRKDKIFDPFYTTRSHLKHLGLGLTLVGAILKNQQADMEIQSERSKGTTVDIKFPTKTQEQEARNFPLEKEPQNRTELQQGADVELKLSSEKQESKLGSIEGQKTVSPNAQIEVPALQIKPAEGLMEMDVDKLFELSEEESTFENEGLEPVTDAHENGGVLEGFEAFAGGPHEASFDELRSDEDSEKTAVIEPIGESQEVVQNHVNSNLISAPQEMAEKSINQGLAEFSVQIRKPGKR